MGWRRRRRDQSKMLMMMLLLLLLMMMMMMIRMVLRAWTKENLSHLAVFLLHQMYNRDLVNL
jgi:hypothetical protein